MKKSICRATMPQTFSNQSKVLKIPFLLIAFLSVFKCYSQAYTGGAILLSTQDYAAIQNVNWDTLIKYAPNKNTSLLTNCTGCPKYLNAPPIGDQGNEGSCVGWAISNATGSLLYPSYLCWDAARRSPSYIFNQIYQGDNCNLGTQIKLGLDLVKNQGVCSMSIMAYVDGGCGTQPTQVQKDEAALNQAWDYGKLAPTDYSAMKNGIDLGYPIVIGFNILQSFKDIGPTGVWNTFTGHNYGGHATVIIGYDDSKQMFKAENQWGASWGDNGFFWIPYGAISAGCLTEAYILYETAALPKITFNGSTSFCTIGEQHSFSPSVLPINCSESFSTDDQSVATVDAAGNVIMTGNGQTTLTATISACGNIIQTLSQPIYCGNPTSITYVTQPGNTTYNLSPSPSVNIGSTANYSTLIHINSLPNSTVNWTQIGSSISAQNFFPFQNNLSIIFPTANSSVSFQVTEDNMCGVFTNIYNLSTPSGPCLAYFNIAAANSTIQISSLSQSYNSCGPIRTPPVYNSITTAQSSNSYNNSTTSSNRQSNGDQQALNNNANPQALDDNITIKEVSLYDMLGRLLKRVELGKGVKNYTMNVPYLRDNVCIVSVTSNSDKIQTNKIILHY